MENKDSNYATTVNVVLRVFATISLSLLFCFIAIWQSLEYMEYEWVWSENNLILSAQYLIWGLWSFMFCTSPAWWFIASCLGLKFFFPKA